MNNQPPILALPVGKFRDALNLICEFSPGQRLDIIIRPGTVTLTGCKQDGILAIELPQMCEHTDNLQLALAASHIAGLLNHSRDGLLTLFTHETPIVAIRFDGVERYWKYSTLNLRIVDLVDSQQHGLIAPVNVDQLIRLIQRQPKGASLIFSNQRMKRSEPVRVRPSFHPNNDKGEVIGLARAYKWHREPPIPPYRHQTDLYECVPSALGNGLKFFSNGVCELFLPKPGPSFHAGRARLQNKGGSIKYWFSPTTHEN